MSAKHTPGPWQVHGSHVYTADPERALLAQVHNPGSKASDYPLIDNARLIAAAPDLLEALNGLIPSALVLINENHPAMKLARAAISKATGGEA